MACVRFNIYSHREIFTDLKYSLKINKKTKPLKSWNLHFEGFIFINLAI